MFVKLSSLFIIFFIPRHKEVDDTLSTICDSQLSTSSSSIKAPRPHLGYAVPFYMHPPPSVTSGQPPLSDLAMEFYKPRLGLDTLDQDVISASMQLDDEDCDW